MRASSKLFRLILAASLALGVARSASAYVFGFSNDELDHHPVTLTLDGSGGATSLSIPGATGSDRGWYRSDGFHQVGLTNYLVAKPGDPGVGTGTPGELYDRRFGFNDFFVFDIHGLSGSFTSATLTLNSYQVTALGDSYGLFDVTTNLDALRGGIGGTAAFLDLGSGNLYGSRAYTVADAGLDETILLNGAFLADLNAAVRRQDAFFAVGGALVPEPASIALMGLGLAALVAARGRRQH